MIGLLSFYIFGLAMITFFANIVNYICHDIGVCGFLGFPWEVWVLCFFAFHSYVYIPMLWEGWKSWRSR